MTINNDLTVESFKQNNKQAYDAFLEDGMKIVTLPANTRLFKLSAYDVTDNAKYNPISAWWSYVHPTEDDDEGAAGRFVQAIMNGISYTAMVRYMSAVRIDWNLLTKYIEINLKEETKAVYGKFAMQVWLSDDKKDEMGKWLAKEQAQLPAHYGVLEAWQLYIPNLYLESGKENVDKITTIDLKPGGEKDLAMASHLKDNTNDDLYKALLEKYATDAVNAPGKKYEPGTMYSVDKGNKTFVAAG